jgi:CheY-like chemotaxis protein
MTVSAWNLIVVEDEDDSADVVRRILTFHKIKHQVVGTAEQALELMEHEMPEALIVDLALPGIDGWELMNRIRRDPNAAAVRVVAVTAFHTPSVAQEAIRAGFDAYFAKPIEATSFVRELDRVLSEDS